MLFERRSTERLEVLVVEPRALVAARLKEQLESLGHRVLGLARDGREAVAAARRLHPSLVLMKTDLPPLDSIEAVRAIVTDRPVPIILVAGYAGADLVRRAREAGVVAYLTSVDRPRLLSAIEVALERFRELQVLRREGAVAGEVPETRRLVDRAKKVLITRLGCSEAEAFVDILERKQSAGRTLRETAWTIIDAEEVLFRLDVARCLQLIFQSVRGDLRPKSRQTLATGARPAPALGLDPANELSRRL